MQAEIHFQKSTINAIFLSFSLDLIWLYTK